MKKTMKCLSAILMTSMLAVSASTMALPAMADDYSINITKADGDEATHVYNAYQIFTGELSVVNGKKQFDNITWGTGVNSANLLAALKASAAFGSGDANLFKDCATASAVARVLEGIEGNSPQANAFADIVHANVTVTKYNIPTEKVPGPGYYYIEDTIPVKPTGSTHYAYSDRILKVVEDTDIATFTAKETVPSLEKKIGTVFADGTKTSTASVGEAVPFVLESKVPDMSKYNDYYYIIGDTLCKGLTFNDDVAITIGSTTLVKDTDFTVTTGTEASPYSFKIVFKNFYETFYQNKTPADTSDDGQFLNQTITVKYTATLNSNADMTSTGNLNEVDLTYSNNPNHTYGGTDEPTDTEEDDDDVMGKTPKSQTKTFTTGIKLTKKDKDTAALLKGAEFQITGDGVKAVLINGEIYQESATGTYYKLKDGTFIDTEPTELTEANYASSTTKYALVSTVTKDTELTSINKSAYTGNDGVITFAGLGAGTYTITELKAPDGYHTLPSPITITIDATLNDADLSCTWDVDDGTNTLTPNADSLYTFEVENSKGITLPGTGGIGTTIFYVVGGSLITLALIMFIVKKRMSIKEK